MIAPDKHISLENSLIGVGAVMLKHLAAPKTITALWEACRSIPSVGTFHRFVLVLDLLYLLGAIEMEGSNIVRSKS
jgi:hypothetical protein